MSTPFPQPGWYEKLNKPEPTEPAPKRKRAIGRILLAIGGVVTLLAWLLVPSLIKSGDGTTLADAHAICSGGLGVIVRAFSSDAAQNCTTINNAWTVRQVGGAVGLALLVWAGILFVRTRRES